MSNFENNLFSASKVSFYPEVSIFEDVSLKIQLQDLPIGSKVDKVVLMETDTDSNVFYMKLENEFQEWSYNVVKSGEKFVVADLHWAATIDRAKK